MILSSATISSIQLPPSDDNHLKVGDVVLFKHNGSLQEGILVSVGYVYSVAVKLDSTMESYAVINNITKVDKKNLEITEFMILETMMNFIYGIYGDQFLITSDMTLDDLDLDSLDAQDLLIAIENKFNLDIDMDKIPMTGSIDNIVNAIHQNIHNNT